MSTKSRLLMCLAAWAAVAWGSAGTALAAEPIYYQIKVLNSGMSEPNPLQVEQQKTRLTRFVERLRAELMVGNLGEANIGCDRCGELVEAEAVEGKVAPPDPLISLKFALLRNGSQLEAFARSYDFIQASELGTAVFAMQIDGSSPGSAACSTAQLNLGCKTRSLCYQTGGCDKVYGGSCDLCLVP